MSQPFASIGGIASGLDTASIVQQLMQLERQPMVLLQQRKAQYQKVDDAWGTVVTRLSSLRASVDGITDPKWLAKTSAASTTNSAVATAKTTGAAQNGSLSFNVTQLARAHQVTLGPKVSSPDHVVGEGSITIERNDGTTLSASLGEGATMADAARALNEQSGISARVLRTGDDEYQLIVTADQTGHKAAFLDVTSDIGDLASVQILSQGQDAALDLGGDLIVKRSSNTITDLLEGVELRLTGEGQVTVEVQQDLDAAVEKVNGFVTALNSMLTHLNTVSKTSAEAGERGPLAGDPLVRSLQMQLRGALSQVVGDGEIRTLSQLGIQLTRTGAVTLDQAKLRDALSSNPAEVASLLGKASNATDARVEVTGVGRAEPGTYQLKVDTAARIAAVTGANYSPPGPDFPKTFTVNVPGQQPIQLTLTSEHDSAASAVAYINAELLSAGVSRLKAVVADLGGGDEAIRFEADRAGTAGSFTIEADPEADAAYLDFFGEGFFGAHDGVDAAGTLTRGDDVWAMTGNGRTLTAPDGAARGLILRVPTDVDGELGDVVVGEGLGSLIDRIMRTAEGSGGSIARSRAAVKGRIDSTSSSIEAFQSRLEIRERTIRRQFTALETAMAKMQSQGAWLASQLGSMSE